MSTARGESWCCGCVTGVTLPETGALCETEPLELLDEPEECDGEECDDELEEELLYIGSRKSSVTQTIPLESTLTPTPIWVKSWSRMLSRCSGLFMNAV